MPNFNSIAILRKLLNIPRSVIVRVALLTSFSLIKLQSTRQPGQQVGEHLFEMHDLVQLATKKWLEVQMQAHAQVNGYVPY